MYITCDASKGVAFQRIIFLPLLHTFKGEYEIRRVTKSKAISGENFPFLSVDFD